MTEVRGIVPILPTPFLENGDVDEAGMRSVVRYVLSAGAHGVAFPAMASEFYSLSDTERVRLTELIVHEVGGAVPVVGTATAQNAQTALELARAVARLGVDAIMVMPPYVVRDNLAGVSRLFARLAEAVDVPLMLQNAPPPLGSAYGPDVIARLVEQVPQVRYVKEEVMPGGQRITALRSSAPGVGVFGGAGGRYIMDELNRGAIGAMPASEITEVHVRIFELFAAGDVAGARALYNRSLPLLTFQAVFRMDMTKEVLKRRGIIRSAHVRIGAVPLDGQDQAELGVLLAELEDVLDAVGTA